MQARLCANALEYHVPAGLPSRVLPQQRPDLSYGVQNDGFVVSFPKQMFLSKNSINKQELSENQQSQKLCPWLFQKFMIFALFRCVVECVWLLVLVDSSSRFVIEYSHPV